MVLAVHWIPWAKIKRNRVDLPGPLLRILSRLEDGTVSMFEWVAAMLLVMGSAAILRAVMVADLEDRSEATTRKAQPAGEDFRKAA